MVGLFWTDGKYKPTALAFSLWSKLCKYEKILNVSVDNSNDIKVLAAKNSKGEIGILAQILVIVKKISILISMVLIQKI